MVQTLSHESRNSSTEPLPGARLSLTLLILINLFNYIDRNVLGAVAPSISREFFGGAETPAALKNMGWLPSAFLISYMLLAPVFGWFADRMSRWVLVGISVLLWSGATAASGLAGSFTVLLLTRIFVGVGEAGYGPAAPTIISDLYPITKRGTVLAWFYVAIPVGSALGYVIGGKVDAWHGWRWAFYAVTVPGLLLGIWAFFMRDPRAGSGVEGSAPHFAKPKMADYLSLAKNPSFLLNTAAMAAMTFAIGGIQFWMPTYLNVRRGLPLADANLYLGIILVVGGLAATLIGGWVGDKLRNRFSGSYFLVSGAGILIACPFVLLMLRVPFPAAWWLLFGAVFFLFFNTGPSNTALANVTHPSVRASAFAMNIFLIHLLGDVPASPALGWIASKLGWNAAFTVVAGMMLAAGLFWLWGAKHLEADTTAASAR